MAKGFYAVLRGCQPSVYNSQMSAEAQIRGFTNAYRLGFNSLQDAQDWLTQQSGMRYPFYEAWHSTTRTHRIYPRCEEPDDAAIFRLQCDGASRGNPGPAGCGGFISNEWLGAYSPRVAEYQHYIGHATNNVAEYDAVLRGLTLALGLGIRNIRVLSDSELVVFQSCGEWTTNHPRLAWYRDFVQALLHEFEWWQLVAVPREDNWDADRLANDAVNEESDGEVLLYSDSLDCVEDEVHRVLSKFSQYSLSAIVRVD